MSKSRLVYAANKYCLCGMGLAYETRGLSGVPIQGFWDCSGILLGTADSDVKHSDIYPFVFYEIKPESEGRGTTRPEKKDE